MFTNEREGQIKFFDNYRIPYNDDNSILIDNTDGVYHGNILEFKLNINNTGKFCFRQSNIYPKCVLRERVYLHVFC